MKFYLIRHAHAEDDPDDTIRPLSSRGKKQVRSLARFLARSGDFTPDEVWTSPLQRADETAGRLLELLGATTKVIPVQALTTTAGVDELAQRLADSRRSLALVGHEPHLSALASLLITGRASPTRFQLKKGAVLALERTGSSWTVCWQVYPDLLG